MHIIAYPINPPTPCDIRPYFVKIETGDHISGNLNSVYEDDGDTLNIRAWWFWWLVYYEFMIDVYFYFDNVKCEELYFDFSSYNTAQEETVVIWVYYTDGTYDGTTQLPDGFHTVALDNWKYIDKVWINFVDHNPIVSGGDRYLLIDLIAAKPVGDNTPPIINIDYQDGDGTDGNPGKWNVYAYDSESGINQNTIGIFIDGQFAGNALGEYNVPNTLGQHTISVEVENNNGCSASRSESVVIIDDDTTYPDINYIYTGDGTDGNPGEIIVIASDDSGLSIDPSGAYPVPNSLGTHNFIFTATDNDNDRVDDALTIPLTIIINIIDDDDTPPEILIDYTGSGFDSNPGFFEWNVFDLDSGINEINITISYESTEGLDDYLINLEGTEAGIWNLPSNLGVYTIEISARDNDDDRTLIVDSLRTELTREQEIIDDDIEPPELSNLIIVPDIFEINVTFDAIDYSGFGDISIFINGELVEPLTQVQYGDTYSFIFENQWLFEIGVSEVVIQVEDGDNDRPNDALTSSISGTFENVLYQMYEYVIWQLEELKNYINENLCNCVARSLNRKLSRAQDHLHEAFNYIENSDITCGLVHDCLAKLFVELAEHKTKFFARRGYINDNQAEYMIDTLQDIRNNIVLLKGASVGSEQAYNIALIEVELLNLKDFIDDEIQCCIGRYLSNMISCSAGFLELALIKISMDYSIECILSCIQWKLERTVSKINHFLEKGKISEEVANYLIENITEIIESLEEIKTS